MLDPLPDQVLHDPVEPLEASAKLQLKGDPMEGDEHWTVSEPVLFVVVLTVEVTEEMVSPLVKLPHDEH